MVEHTEINVHGSVVSTGSTHPQLEQIREYLEKNICYIRILIGLMILSSLCGLIYIVWLSVGVNIVLNVLMYWLSDKAKIKVREITKLNYYRLKAVGLEIGCKPTKALHQS
jgi:hypothetical protein